MFLVMNWSREEKKFLAFVVKSTISNPLKVGLTFREKRNMVKGIAYSTVSGNLLLFPRHLQERSIFIIIVHLYHDRNKNLKRNITKSLYSAPDRMVWLSSAAYLDAVFIWLEIPSSLLDLILIKQYIGIFHFDNIEEALLILFEDYVNVLFSCRLN
jgi:hypothetical protein